MYLNNTNLKVLIHNEAEKIHKVNCKHTGTIALLSLLSIYCMCLKKNNFTNVYNVPSHSVFFQSK